MATQLAREFAVFGLDWKGMKSDELCNVCISEAKDQDIAVVHGDSCAHCVCFWCLVFSNLAMMKRQAKCLSLYRVRFDFQLGQLECLLYSTATL